jgi:tetratricopeptide (TPR) repeat protein
MTRAWLAKGSLIALALASSATNLGNGFAQDDMPVIERNPVVHTLARPWTFFTQSYWPKPFSPALYRPLATTSFAVEWQVGRGRPWVFRAASIAMYAGAGLALLHLAGLLLPPLAAWLAAAFFLAHPVHVEAVAVAVNQSEVMVGLLAILAVSLYIRVRRSGQIRARDAAALFGFYLAATLYKESGLVVIGLLVAAEVTIVADPRGLGERLARIRPLLLVMLLGATCFFAIRTLALEGDPVGTFTAEALHELSLGQRALTMLGVVPHWFRLLLWPAHLRGDYSPREIESATTWGLPQTLGAFELALALAVAVAAWRRYPVITFGLLWTAVGLFPVSNVLVPTGVVLAERTLFLASAGMMLTVGGFVGPVIGRLGEAPRIARGLTAAAIAAIMVMAVTRSASRQRVWKDQFTFWHQTTIDAPLSYRAHHALAQLLFQIGARRWAEKEYRAAIALYPKQWGAYLDLANKLRLNGMCEHAVRYYRQTLLIEYEHEAARTSLIACLLDLGLYADARAEAREGMSYASRPARLKAFQRFFVVADSAQRAGAPRGTVRLRITAADTLP